LILNNFLGLELPDLIFLYVVQKNLYNITTLTWLSYNILQSMPDQKNYATKKCIFQKMYDNGNLKTCILRKKT
jgi:hypothetical protein